MKSYLSIFALFIASSILLNGEAYPGLKVIGNHKELCFSIIFQDGGTDLTKDSFERAIKLRLIKNGIKPLKPNSTAKHFLLVKLQQLESDGIFRIGVTLSKISERNGVSPEIAGFSFTPSQGPYSFIGKSRQNGVYIIESLEEALDMFILNYLESNIE